MPSLEIDELGLGFRWGALEFYANNATPEEPGDFSLRLPLGPLGLLVVGYDSWTGWDCYRLTREEAQASVASLQRVRELMANPESWWHLEEPTAEDLAQLEAELGDLLEVEE